eukprot:CAMPEP_0201477616 /NCGR_PEP_ID=MMETSP0151_2-20130828/2607_1 /ASSEMBLY_ACC=CAM_ASM_000257 /TAXON_ID=200890 /ORGANISM="Paramoeba atlantica, Strain 621/1 / CCAP 1560/9" /LENGTH=201 /DNA_ID=CAMNT_0047858401 /DNA_START=1120 /DNA_END=1725 /DNA_ORIENTATION=-
MKRSFAGLEEKYKEKFQSLVEQLPLAPSVVGYRKLLSNPSYKTTVPYVGLLAKDLLFLNDGNSDWYAGHQGSQSLNWSAKFSKIAESIFESKEQLGRIYGGSPQRNLFEALILNFKVLTYEEAFQWSRRVEPKDFEVVIGELLLNEQRLSQQLEASNREIQELKQELEKKNLELAESRGIKEEPKRRKRRDTLGPVFSSDP